MCTCFRENFKLNSFSAQAIEVSILRNGFCQFLEIIMCTDNATIANAATATAIATADTAIATIATADRAAATITTPETAVATAAVIATTATIANAAAIATAPWLGC